MTDCRRGRREPSRELWEGQGQVGAHTGQGPPCGRDGDQRRGPSEEEEGEEWDLVL